MPNKPKSKKTTEQLLVEISQKLDMLIAAIAIQGKGTDEQVEILTKAGFDSNQMGFILGMHPGSIRNLKSAKKKKK